MGGYSNPFDQPLGSEVQESAQRQQDSVKTSPSGNPFDEPLASEVAEQKHAAAVTKKPYSGQAMGSKVPDSILNGPDSTGEAIAGITGAGISLSAASPVVEALAEHLPNLSKAYQVLKTLGEVGAGTGGAVYTLEHLKKVLGIIGGGSSKK